MMLLDTNVLSEILKPEPSERVANWVRKYPRVELFTTAVTQSEILYGIAIMPGGKRRSLLQSRVETVFVDLLADRVLPFDSRAAKLYAEVASLRRAMGRPMPQLDAQIGAIALANRAGLATRNTNDFDGCGIHLVNPWTD